MAWRKTINAISAHHVLRAAARMGLDPRPLAALAGVPLDSLPDPAQRIPFDALLAVWERAMRA